MATPALAEALGAGLTDAAAEGLEPPNAFRSMAARSTFQCMPAALAMMAAPAIQIAASAERAMAPPSLLTRYLPKLCSDPGRAVRAVADRIDDQSAPSAPIKVTVGLCREYHRRGTVRAGYSPVDH